MNRTQCLKALELMQRKNVRCVDYQNHPPGNISAYSPWAIRAWDKNGLRVDFDNYNDATKWVYNYWLNESV